MVLTELLSGSRWTAAGTLPLTLYAVLDDLRPRFLPKCRVGRSYRAVARNGRVLLASDVSIPELIGRVARLRLQPWHRAILPGDRPEPFGILVDVRSAERPPSVPLHSGRLVRAEEALAAIVLDVGGGLVLALDPMSNSS
jgi:hypothetical protein